ncbi:unnamed protein product, partial [Owenia fusiformis]
NAYQIRNVGNLVQKHVIEQGRCVGRSYETKTETCCAVYKVCITWGPWTDWECEECKPILDLEQLEELVFKLINDLDLKPIGELNPKEIDQWHPKLTKESYLTQIDKYYKLIEKMDPKLIAKLLRRQFEMLGRKLDDELVAEAIADGCLLYGTRTCKRTRVCPSCPFEPASPPQCEGETFETKTEMCCFLYEKPLEPQCIRHCSWNECLRENNCCPGVCQLSEKPCNPYCFAVDISGYCTHNVLE